jgi:hypothetical protein
MEVTKWLNPHGKGIAIDVSAILLADRRRIAVGHEASPQEALFMQRLRMVHDHIGAR